jgi:hypothetical protein
VENAFIYIAFFRTSAPHSANSSGNMTVQKDLSVGAAGRSTKVSCRPVRLAGQRATKGPAVHFQATPTRPQAELRGLAAINAELNLPSQSTIHFIKPDCCPVLMGD